LKRLPKDLHEEVSDPTMIYCDKLSNIQLPKNHVFHARTKHIEVHYHFVHERVLFGEVELQYVPTDRQTADVFTKPLGLNKLRQFSGALGLRHLDVPNLRGREEIANSDSESRSKKADRRFDSDMLNQPRPKRTKRKQRKRQRRDSKEAQKGRVSEQADQKGRCTRTGTSRGARIRREAKRDRSRDTEEP
jgi:hypothetical protein